MPIRAALLVLVLTPALAAQRGPTLGDEDLGVRWRLPEDWVDRTEAASGDDVVALAVPGDGRTMQLEVGVGLALGKDEAGHAEESLERLERAGYPGARPVEQRVAKRAAKGFDLVASIGGARWHVRRLFVVDDDLLYRIEAVTPADEWEARLSAVEDAWKGLRLDAPPSSKTEVRRFEMLARLCGSELTWSHQWETAARRAREQGRLVLVDVNAYGGFDIPDKFKLTTFMDPDVVDLVEACYVPLDLGSRRDVPFAAQSSYGMSSSTFGASCMVVTPDGRVVAERIHPTYDFLREHAPRGAALPEDLGSLERARAELRRGRHAEALAALEGDDSAAAHRLRADVARREMRGADALAALDAARVAEGGDDLARDLDVDRAWVLVRTGRTEEARALLEAFGDAAPDHARAREARFLLGAVEGASGDLEETERIWRRTIERQPESRWAWQAAGLLNAPGWGRVKGWSLAWLAPEVRAELEPRPYAPLPHAEAETARTDAVRWLLEHQRADGSWLSWTAVRRSEEQPPDDFQLANVAFAIRGLLGARERDGVDAALERSRAWLSAALERHEKEGGDVHYMDYAVWSYSCSLQALVDLHEAGLLPRDRLGRHGSWLVRELLDRQSPAGGWSYYVTDDLESGKTESVHSFSFVTAHVLLALGEAEAAGLAVPRRALEDGADALEAMRSHEVLFEYSLGANSSPESLPGAAGRAPVCMLALLRAGRVELDDLRAALDAYYDNVATLTKELGKCLMHAGAHGQGCHYPLFDHLWAAEALGELPPEERRGSAVRLLDELLQARTDAGSFYDMPSLGDAWGTGVAIRVISSLTE